MKKYVLFVFILCSLLLCSACSVPSVRPVTLGDQQKSLVLIDQGTQNLRLGKLEEARAAFELAKQLNGAPAAIDGLGCIAFLRGDFSIAKEYFLQAYSIDDTYIESRSHLALLYDYLGHKNESEIVYKRAMKHQPDNPLARNNYGAFLENDMRASAASEEFYKAFALLPHPVIDSNVRVVEPSKKSAWVVE